MTFKYSVIIPHYNSADSLKRLLESIPNNKSIEVIVVDDRSSSRDFENVIKESHLINLTFYINDGVKGAGAARNVGLKKARGEFLVFSDADDFFTHNAFSHIDTCINSSKDNYDIYFFNVTSQQSNGEVGHRHLKVCNLVYDYLNKLSPNYEEKIRLTHNVPWGKVFRTDFIRKNKINFDEVLVSNDVMFSLKAGKLAKKIQCSKKQIYCVTQNEGTLTTKKNLNNYWIRIEVFTRYYHFLSDEEKRKTSVSPLPLLLAGKKYGLFQVLKACFYLKKNKVYLFKYLSFDSQRIRRAFKIY